MRRRPPSRPARARGLHRWPRRSRRPASAEPCGSRGWRHRFPRSGNRSVPDPHSYPRSRQSESSRCASRTAICSRVVSIMTIASGSFSMSQDAIEVACSFAAFAPERGQLLLAHLLEIGRLLDLLDVFQAADAFADRGQVRQRAAQPALVHIKLSAGDRRFLDRFLRLLLAADEENLARRAASLPGGNRSPRSSCLTVSSRLMM